MFYHGLNTRRPSRAGAAAFLKDYVKAVSMISRNIEEVAE